MRTRTKIVALVVSFAVLVGATVPALYFTGVIGAGLYRMPTKGYSRPTVAVPAELPVPATLSELLARSTVTVDALLSNPAVEQELMDAKILTDVVDSRLALRNLRSLQTDAQALSAGLLATRSAPATGEDPVPLALGLPSTALETRSAALSAKISSLLATTALPVLVSVSKTEFKAVWTTPDEVRLRWTPHGEWIPADGYTLTRIVDGVETVVASALGSLASIDKLSAATDDLSKSVVQLFADSTLTPAKKTLIGTADDAAFAALVYGAAVDNTARTRIAGAKDFSFIRSTMLSVSATPSQKLTRLDLFGTSSIANSPASSPNLFSLSDARLSIATAITLVPLELQIGAASTTRLASGAASTATARDTAVTDLLSARRTLLTRAFVDAEFATASGLGYDDDLSALKLAAGTPVSYRLTNTAGDSWSVDVVKGTEQKVARPTGLDAYGMDNLVSMRWTAPTSDFDRSSISGYFVERKGPGAGGFTRITPQPVAISYGLDATGVFFEAPVFFQDAGVLNGQTATYRIQALDIFGRLSDYSADVRVKVVKVTPPAAPNVDQPVLSADSSKRLESFFRTLETLNKGVPGIILPAVRSSADTDTLVVYRSVAIGAGSFSAPVELARFPVSAPGDPTAKQRTVRVGKGRVLLAPTASGLDLAYYDAAVKPGEYYKYWVAAVDTWGNESAWSSAKVVGVPLNDPPADPSAPIVSLARNVLPDLSLTPPGFARTLTSTLTLKGITESLLDALSSPGATPSPGASFVTGSDKVLGALTQGVQFGVSVSSLVSGSGIVPADVVSADFGNLPAPDRIHAILAYEQKDLLPDGSAKVSWMPYQGDGLGSYQVYRTQVDGASIAALRTTPRSTIAQNYVWKRVRSGLLDNLFIDGPLERKEGRITLYMVSLTPSAAVGSTLPGFNEAGFVAFAPGGWVQLAWIAPRDPQVSGYRVYRAEVAGFPAGDAVPTDLAWMLVSDRDGYPSYTEKVDQTYAHYYYYKVTSVSVWGQESAGTAVSRFRVPATSPPQTPAMLLPLQKKGAVQVNWSGVPHASKYTVYRTTIPKIEEADLAAIEKLRSGLYNSIFQTGLVGDTYLRNRLKIPTLVGSLPTATTPVLSADKFNTLQMVAPSKILAAVKTVAPTDKLSVFRDIAAKYGPLALAPYGQLSEAAAALVKWDEVGEVAIASGTDSIGAFSYTDSAVTFGARYLYTVQAENDDALLSGRPMPEAASPRKSQPFNALAGVAGTVVTGKPVLTWPQATDPGLTWQESREYVAGYIVYRSTEENGFYHQASPLVADLTWRDENADPYAFNWYKIKVVDTGGYLSDFSAPVLVRSTPPFLFKAGTFLDVKPYLKVAPASVSGVSTSSASSVPGASPSMLILLPVHYDTLPMGGFTLKDITLTGTSGTAKLLVADDRSLDVVLTGAYVGNGYVYAGTATLAKSAVLDESGMHLSKLVLVAGSDVATVDGYMTAPTTAGEAATKNLVGDLYSIQFKSGNLRADGTVGIGAVPGFRYDNLVFSPVLAAELNLSAAEPPAGRVRLFRGTVEYALGLETVDNIGLAYSFSTVSFNAAGKLTGQFALKETRTLRLVIPAGLGVRVASSTLSWVNGAVDATSSNIAGKLVLPFRTYNDAVPIALDPGAFGSDVMIDPAFPDLRGIDRLLPEGSIVTKARTDFSSVLSSLGTVESASLDDSMLYLGYQIQASSLLVLSSDPAVQETMSTVPFNVAAWSGSGFTLADASMTPALVGNSAELTGEEIGITPGRVSVDLDRTAAVPVDGAPAETQLPFWLGIAVKDGRLSLPSDYIMTDTGSRVSFALTPGQMLYDLNGISYQSVVSSTAGIPVDFGKALGGFRDVRVFSCVLDLYANKVNVEIRGDLGIPLFGYQRANVKLFTSKELGTLVCTVDATDKFDPSGTGEVLFKVSGGQLLEDGLHMNGSLDLAFKDKIEFKDLAFTDLVVPADMAKTTAEGNPDGLYGKAVFDMPLTVDFHGFPMEVRALSFASTKKTLRVGLLKPVAQTGTMRSAKLSGFVLDTASLVDTYPTTLTLWGGMQLTDKAAMDTSENFDRIVFADVMTSPDIRYEEAKSKLKLDFEQFSSINAIATPKPGLGDDTLVEYNTDNLEMAFDAAAKLTGVKIDCDTRLGLDKALGRFFFALAIFYDDPLGGISFGYGRVNQITGMFGYNLDLPRKADGHFDVPKGKGALFASIDTLKVDRSTGGNWFFAASANLYLALGAGTASAPMGEVRDLYLFVEKGPDVEMGGDFYAPTDITNIGSGSIMSRIGSARISYYHVNQLLQFSLELRDFPICSYPVTGDLGFDMSPAYWEVRIGYPETLRTTAYGLATVGFGIIYRDSDTPGESYVKAKMLFDFDSGNIELPPVYLHAYLYAFAEGQYLFDQKELTLEVWLNGGLDGGISAFGKHYSIIHLQVDAYGKLTNGGGDWHLTGRVNVYYSLDLWLDEIEGSVDWNIDKTF